MKLAKQVKCWVVALACVGLLNTQFAMAVAPARVTFHDVKLHQGGALRGQLVSEEATPLAKMEIHLVNRDAKYRTVLTDEQGNFEFRGTTPGLYSVVAGDTATNYRVWSDSSAPPQSRDGVLLVRNAQVTRGAQGNGLAFLANPWVLAGVVAAAIAIPLALDNGDAS